MKNGQMTTESSQKPRIKPAGDVVIEQGFELVSLRAEAKRLGQELQRKVIECDELRFDVAGLCGELAEEKRQRIEANSLLLKTARALDLDDSEIDELPQIARKTWELSEKNLTLEARLARALAHIKSLALRISLEVVRGNELREAYHREQEKRGKFETALRQIEADGIEHWDSCPFCLAHWREEEEHEDDCPYYVLKSR